MGLPHSRPANDRRPTRPCLSHASTGSVIAIELRPLIGLCGVLVATMNAQLNDQVVSTALADIQGALGISHDQGVWITATFTTGEGIGMALAPWWAVTVGLQRFTFIVIGFNLCVTLLIPFAPGTDALIALRCIQGLAGGLTIPLLMTTALRFLKPEIRIYGLAIYALTATFTPNVCTALAVFSTDVIGWRFMFFEALPFSALAALLVWYGLPQDKPHWVRLDQFDWAGLLLILIGVGSLTTMLSQGDRLDWFNSPLVCVLAGTSGAALGLLLINEWYNPLPLLKLQLLLRPNFAFGVIGVFVFLIIGLSAGTIPSTFLQLVHGYRPLQSQFLTLEVGAGQLLLLPAVAYLLDHRHVDARVVCFVGLALIFGACLGESLLTSAWNRDEFYSWQVPHAIGQPLVILPLLMIATNAVKPDEGPFASALVNLPRALAEATGGWALALITRWRGALHSERLVDRVGQVRFSVVQAQSLLPHHPSALLPSGQPRTVDSLSRLAQSVGRQTTVLVLSDAFLVIAGLTIALMIVLALLPRRTQPPRLIAQS